MIYAHLDNQDTEWREEMTFFNTTGRQVLLCRGSLLPAANEQEFASGYIILFDDITNLVQATACGHCLRRRVFDYEGHCIRGRNLSVTDLKREKMLAEGQQGHIEERQIGLSFLFHILPGNKLCIPLEPSECQRIPIGIHSSAVQNGITLVF